MKVLFAAAAAAASATAAAQHMRGLQLMHVLKEGDLCKSGGVETGKGVDNSKHCPKPLQCKAQTGVMGIGGEVNKYCCKATGSCGPKGAQTHNKAEWCPESPDQMCRMMCPTPTCDDEDACALRTGNCCQFKCTVPTPGQNGEDDDDCNILDGIDEDKEMQYKEEFDLLDANDDGAISTTENTKGVQAKWQSQYGKYCNDKDNSKGWGNWNSKGKNGGRTADQWQKIKQQYQSGKDKATGAVQNGKDAIKSWTDKVTGKSSGSGKTGGNWASNLFGGRRLQKDGSTDGSKGGRPGKAFGKWGGKKGWGKNQDEDCSQQLSNKAATFAQQIFKKLDADGDSEVSFCEYATLRNRGLPSMVTVHGRALVDEM